MVRTVTRPLRARVTVVALTALAVVAAAFAITCALGGALLALGLNAAVAGALGGSAGGTIASVLVLVRNSRRELA